MTPRVSIIVCAYNGAAFLERHALTSALAQSFGDFELIVIDDGSTDDTEAVVRAFAARDARVRYVRTENHGLAAAMNRGVRESRGEIIAFLEQDDAWLKDKLAKQVTLIDAGRQLVWCRAFNYDLARRAFTGFGGGNFSTFAGSREGILMFYPLDEDRRFAGIEDGLLAAELALAEAAGRLVATRDLGSVDEPLVICATGTHTQSGERNPAMMCRRYGAVLERYGSMNAACLRTLVSSWRRGYLLNRLMLAVPRSLRAPIYFMSGWRHRHKAASSKEVLSRSKYFEEAESMAQMF